MNFYWEAFAETIDGCVFTRLNLLKTYHEWLAEKIRNGEKVFADPERDAALERVRELEGRK